jgi:serine/threonine-protein kinase
MITRRGTILGTAFYMSPEQAQCFQDLDGRTDLWSLGAILYECLSGRPPHVGSAYEAILIAICTQDAEDVRVHAPDVPEPMAAVIARALQRDRSLRFQSAEEFYRALAEAVPGVIDTKSLAAGPRRPSTPAPPSPEPLATGAGTAVRQAHVSEAQLHRRRTAVAVLVAALGTFALTAFWMTRQPAPSRTLAPMPAASAAAETPRTVHAEPPSTTPVREQALEDAAAPQVLEPRTTPSTRLNPRNSASSRSKATPAASTRAPSGVASQLELSTSGP